MKLLRIVLLCLVVASGQAFADDSEKQAKKAKQSAPAKTSTRTAGKQEFVPGGVAQSFVIPKNTCESGTPIQKLLTDKPPSDKPK
jgi:hypothetical protein